jgi:branched-chain amino acid transport system substrate-binding protein
MMKAPISSFYASGRDQLQGMREIFEGQVLGQEMTRWPDQLDFSAELSKARASGAESIFVFYPGASGIQFVTQYAQAGLKGQIPLYTVFVVDELSLPRLKDLAIGIPGTLNWVNDLPNEANKKFVTDFIAKYKTRPSYYAAQTYDGVNLLDSAVSAVHGDLSKKEEMRKAMERADFKSVRGSFKFGNNHIPIQNFYLQDAVKQGDDYVLKTAATVVENDPDRFHDKCPMKLGQ